MFRDRLENLAWIWKRMQNQPISAKYGQSNVMSIEHNQIQRRILLCSEGLLFPIVLLNALMVLLVYCELLLLHADDQGGNGSALL